VRSVSTRRCGSSRAPADPALSAGREPGPPGAGAGKERQNSRGVESTGTLAEVTIDTPTLIIGAGPAGLAVAGRLHRLGTEFEMVEASDRVADSWHGHYDRLHLHTVKQHSHLPHMPFPSTYPRYVPRRMLVDYFSRYAETLQIRPRFGVRITSVVREGEVWRAESSEGDVFRSPNIVIATGINRVPHRPSLPGEEDFEGWITHSRDYRNPERFLGHRVLVVGMGNTGAEIALDLCEHGVATTISVRGPVNIVPRDVLGRPTQLTAMLTARLPERLGDRLGMLMRNLTVGDLSAVGIETPRLPPAAQLRVHGRTPVMDIGTVKRIKSGEIRVKGAVARLTTDAVVFSDGSEERFDDIILATGYRPVLEEILPDHEGLLDANGVPHRVVAGVPHRGLFFIGFDNYQPGGILGTILGQSETIAEALTQPTAAG
jgi:cation diffusion facilitator CzcD-associated flavoprotein CzcO